MADLKHETETAPVTQDAVSVEGLDRITEVINARLARGEMPGANFPSEWWSVIGRALRSYGTLKTEHGKLLAALNDDSGFRFYLDGVAAALDVAESVRMHATWGPAATPDDGLKLGLDGVKDAVRKFAKRAEEGTAGRLRVAAGQSLSPPEAPQTGGQVERAIDFRCGLCGCRSCAPVDERKPDGSFGSGPLVRCVNCKEVQSPSRQEGEGRSAGWQPIETAPRDGSWIEAWIPRHPEDEADLAVAGVHTLRWSAKGFWWNAWTGFSHPEHSPAGWRPLSTSPSQENSDGA